MFSVVCLQCVSECPRWGNGKCGRRGTSTSSRKWEVDSYDDKSIEKEVWHEVTQNIFSGLLHADVRGFARSWKQSRYYASYAQASTLLCDALPSSCVAIVHHALRKTSQEYLIACLRVRALVAPLSYPGFFSTEVQRVAPSTAANMCKKLIFAATQIGLFPEAMRIWSFFKYFSMNCFRIVQ